jgi:RNA polymerase sigma-70 factor, ECF subfamily
VALTRLARDDAGRVLAILARKLGDLDLADESVQDALLEATRLWPERGIPSNPPAWLLSVARRKAIDRLRRAASAKRRTMAAAHELVRDANDFDDTDHRGGGLMIDDSAMKEPRRGRREGAGSTNNANGNEAALSHTPSDETRLDETVLDETVPTETAANDDHLRLMLLCSHPALDRNAQVALTLRLVGGLTTAEIAAASLVPEATLAQRIVRAKKKIRDANIPLSMPDRLDERVDVLLSVLYLIFNEGYLSRSAGESAIRVDLVDEAIRLTRLVTTLVSQPAEPEGLLAMELYHQARLSTRLDREGELVLLDQQDRSRWDLAVIAEANQILGRMMARQKPGPYQVQAIIAGHHANARTADDTDWTTIVKLYEQLRSMTRSPVVALNHAVAVAMTDGPLAGLALLDDIEGLDSYHLAHSTRAELLMRAGRAGDAVAEFERARKLTENAVEQRHLDRRRSDALARTFGPS